MLPGLLPALLLVVVYLIWRVWQNQVQSHYRKGFAEQHGCVPIRLVFGGKLPFGIDLVKDLLTANANQHLLLFLQPFITNLGPTLELRILGNAGIVTTDPENVKAVLTKSKLREGEMDWGYGERRDALLPLFGDGIFTQDGAPWKRSREMLRKQFARIHYHNLENFSDNVELLISRLSKAKGYIIDLQPLFFNFTLDTSTTLLFGESAGSLEESYKDEFGASLYDASWFSAIRVQLAYLYWICCPPQFFKACKRVNAYADTWVKKALDSKVPEKTSSSQHELIQTLYDEYQDRKRVREQLVNVLLAGRDTTACLLSWTFRLLVRHPSVLKRLQEEIASVQGEEPEVSKASVQQMPYLKHVLTETLRLYPPVPVNFREANVDTVLPHGGGPDGMSPIMVPKQMGIGYSPYHMHRRKDLYGQDALEFRPERWEDGSLEKSIGWGYLPFNAGPRVCLGQEFALLEASYAVVRIIQAFPHLSLPKGEKIEPIGNEPQSITLTMAPAEGCKVQL